MLGAGFGDHEGAGVGSSIITSALELRAVSETVEQNKTNVAAFIAAYHAKDIARMTAHVAAGFVRHGADGTRTYTPMEYGSLLSAVPFFSDGKPVTRSQIEVFGEGDTVFAIFSLTAAGTDESSVEAFRLAGGKIVEMWIPPSAAARWEWTPSTGEGDTETTRDVQRRWYQEMYRDGRYLELAPQLCGPIFIRHESSGTFSATAEEHGKRLHDVTRGNPSPAGNYRAFAEGDTVGAIGRGQLGGNFVQAWRVADGKLVESWWPGFTALGVDWGL
jgi:predicted SnoaL-like aldol condensation-catalyzing enzyme